MGKSELSVTVICGKREGRDQPNQAWGLSCHFHCQLHLSLPQYARAQPGRLGVFEEYRI